MVQIKPPKIKIEPAPSQQADKAPAGRFTHIVKSDRKVIAATSNEQYAQVLAFFLRRMELLKAASGGRTPEWIPIIIDIMTFAAGMTFEERPPKRKAETKR